MRKTEPSAKPDEAASRKRLAPKALANGIDCAVETSTIVSGYNVTPALLRAEPIKNELWLFDLIAHESR